MKTKQRKAVPKTRGHKVEKRPYVPIRKLTSSQRLRERQGANTEEYSQDSERKGEQDSDSGEGRENKEKHAQVEPIRDTENSEKSVHPGPVQTVHHMSEQPQTACDTETEETHIEAELLQ